MKSEEIDERLSDTESVLLMQEKRINKLEQGKSNQPTIPLLDYSQEFKWIKHALLRSLNSDDLVQVKQTLADISSYLKKDSKPVNKSYRLLLFPETNAGYYYKIVFGRLIPNGILFCIIVFLFSLGQQSIEAWKAYQYNQRAQRCVRAWIYMNEHASKQVKNAMDEAWLESEKK